MKNKGNFKKLSIELSATADLLADWKEVSPNQEISWAYRLAAAVMDTFNPGTIQPYDENGSILSQSYPNPENDADLVIPQIPERWRLHCDLRREALEKLATRQNMKDALALNPDIADTSLQRMLTSAINDTIPDDLRALTRDDLSALVTVASWLKSIIKIPDLDSVARVFALKDLLSPFEHLTSDGFVGREMEITLLHSYLTSDQDGTEPLLLYGVGGVGKSSLLAQFILQAVRDPTNTPFLVHLDMDSPTVSPQHLHTFVIEITRQLLAQDPGLSAHGRANLRSVRDLAKRLPSDLERRYSESTGSLLLEYLLNSASALLTNALESSKERKVLIVLDTFEEAQIFGESVAYSILMFMKLLQSRVHNVRIVIAGRGTPPEGLRKRVGLERHPVQINSLDPRSAGILTYHLLEKSHLQHDEAVIQEIVSVVGRNPLSLKLAVRAISLQGFSAFLDTDSRSQIVEKLRQERVQGYLFGRILNYLKDERLKKLVYPGILLRRVTPQLIWEVLKEPCEIEVQSIDDSTELFRSFEKVMGVVEPDGNEGLRFRLELRREILGDVLRVVDPKIAEAIDARAVKFYESDTTPFGRAEELYHRLRLNQSNDILEARWSQNAWSHLKQSITELPAQSQLWLAQKANVSLDVAVRRKASDDEWEDEAARMAESLLKLGRADETLEVLRERPARPRSSKISLLEAQALRLLGREDEASEILILGLKEASIPQKVEILLLLALIDENRDQLHRALQTASQAFRISSKTSDILLKLRTLVTRLRLFRKLNMSSEHEKLRAKMVKSVSEKVLKLLRDHPALFQEVAAELGASSQKILKAAIDRLGMLITSKSQREALIRALDQLTTSVSVSNPSRKHDELGISDVDEILRSGGAGLGDKVVGILGGKPVDHTVLESLTEYFRGSVDVSLSQNWSEGLFGKGKRGENA